LLRPETLRIARGAAADDDAAGDGGGGGGGAKRKPSRQIRIQEVRDAIDWIVQTNSRGRSKVLLLHPAEALNLQSASALLKTLEEPPSGARLLLSCTDAERLLPTVRSRCQRLVLPLPTNDVARRWLQQQEMTAADADVLLAATAGQPLEALALYRTGIDAAGWSALPQALRDGRAAAWSGWPLGRTIDALAKLCHDLMAVAAGARPRYYQPSTLGGEADLAALAEWAHMLQRVERQAEHPWSEALLVDALESRGRRALATLAR
jgi:DNA polymerase-3 subunit delta'